MSEKEQQQSNDRTDSTASEITFSQRNPQRLLEIAVYDVGRVKVNHQLKQAQETQLKSIQLWGRNSVYTLNHTKGDHDFYGHGPDVSMYAYITVRNENELWATTYMSAEETEPDWTTASGQGSRKIWDGTDFFIDEIVSIDSDAFTRASYTDTDHGTDIIDKESGELVDYFSVVGDTGGDDVNDAHTTAIFNPISLTVRQWKGPFSIYAVPPYGGNLRTWVSPVHTGGDRDFYGHGPDVNMYAYITVRNENELWATAYMSAKETESDWTSASGTYSRKIWDGDDWFVNKIVSIQSDTFTHASYTDTDHEEDILNQGSDELVDYFAVVGDTDGDDVGEGTSMIAYFNPVVLRVRP